MKRFTLLAAAFISVCYGRAYAQQSDREYWIEEMVRMAEPVVRNLSENTLRENIPVGRSSSAQNSSREFVTHMESVGRTFAGIAPWLELGPDPTPEGVLRARFIEMSRRAIANSVDPLSPDYFDSHATRQILVNSAFLIQGMLRAPKQLWEGLDDTTKERLLAQWRTTRTMKPGNNNWLLFSAMVECGLRVFGGEWEFERVRHAVDSHKKWYVGDGIYGDGEVFHLDYYNSFVIHPMLMQVLEVAHGHTGEFAELIPAHRLRMQRYAQIQERMIAPDGTYPLVGRSITYRLGAFQVLAQAAQTKMLPAPLSEGGVRAALTAVIRKQMDFPGTYDGDGWLTIGVCGEQPELGDSYLSTPCLYLASLVFLPLGLPADDTFWTSPAEEWTSVKAFSGGDAPIDKFLKE